MWLVTVEDAQVHTFDALSEALAFIGRAMATLTPLSITTISGGDRPSDVGIDPNQPEGSASCAHSSLL